jgi:glycosyltransferase involved in cell wall biosynthesis
MEMSLRVLHVIPAFSPLTETFLYDLVSEVASRTEAMVVTQRRVDAESRPFEPVHVIASGGGRFGAVRDRLVRWFARDAPPAGWIGLRRALCEVVRAFGPDVVHAHFGDQGVFAAPVAGTLGIPLVTSFYGYDASELPRDPRWRRWYRPLAAGRNRAVVLSHAMRRELASVCLAEERTIVVGTGKRLSEYPYRPPRASPARFLSVGRLVEKKGHADAIEAFGRVAADCADLSLDIVGDGPLSAALQARIDALRLRDRVRLLGPRDHGQTKELMRTADAFILCSRTASSGDREGVPTVLMEAQALGLPCVTTWHAGIPEVIPAANHGLLAPEGDVVAITAAIRRVRATPLADLAAWSARGAEHVREHYDLARQAERLLDVYRAAAHS